MSQPNSFFMRRGDYLNDRESDRNFDSQFYNHRQNSYQNEYQDASSSDAGRNSDRTYTAEDRGYKSSLKMNENRFNNSRDGPYRSTDRSYQVPYHRKYPPSRNDFNSEYQPKYQQYSPKNQFRSDSQPETPPRSSRNQFCPDNPPHLSRNQFQPDFTAYSSSNPSKNLSRPEFPTECQPYPPSNQYRQQFPTESSSNLPSDRYRQQLPTESSSNLPSDRYRQHSPTRSSSNPSSNRFSQQFQPESSSNPSSNRFSQQSPTGSSSNTSSNRYRQQSPTRSSSNLPSDRYRQHSPTRSSSNPSSNRFSQQFPTESSSNLLSDRYRQQSPTRSSSNPSSNRFSQHFPPESSSNLPSDRYRQQFSAESQPCRPENQCDSNSLAKNPSYPPRNQFCSEFPTESSPNPIRNKFYTQDQHQSYRNEKFEPQEPNWHHPNVGEFERMVSFKCNQKNQQQSPLDRIPALSSQNPLNSYNNESINAASSKNGSNVGNKFQSLKQGLDRIKNTPYSKNVKQVKEKNNMKQQVISPEESKHADEFRLIEHIIPVEKEYSEITIDDIKNREGPVGDIVIMNNKHKDKTYFKILKETAETWNMLFYLNSEQCVSAEGKISWIATVLFNDVELSKAQGENKGEVRTAAGARALWKLYQWYFTVEKDEAKKTRTHDILKGDSGLNDFHIVPNRASQIGVASVKATFQTIKNKNLNHLRKQIESYANDQTCLGYLILSENFNASTRKSLIEYAKTFKNLQTPKFNWNQKSQVVITKLEDVPVGWALIEKILEKRDLYKSSGEYQLYFPGKFPFPIPYAFPGVEFLTP
ncbi:uncharacterized protein LOC111063237 isoform X3 [Nilaparvata lugens]|uniref:uncharacterized protein LOC111063237 isoform X2 n=1 Tax=Nilaparvata lugens TaxID=108931 RepID=UPI00193DE984|nr:uncharacterized protein LOC111063237 isoform X2 [Nilaparvata lugens]XP_039289035.1 uncharacterized protein LOC111063237 isoform X3 [Nilaparvata lugens]